MECCLETNANVADIFLTAIHMVHKKRTLVLEQKKKTKSLGKIISNLFTTNKKENSDADLLPFGVHRFVAPDTIKYGSIDLNEFKLDKTIGKGAFGAVHLAFWKNQNMNVAIKEYYAESHQDHAEFYKESKVMEKIRSPFLVRHYAYGVNVEGSMFIVLEYMNEGSLSYFLHKKKQQLDSKQLVRIALDIARGLSYLHEKNILHGDLKSPNVLLYMDTRHHLRAKLADFGTCVAANSKNNEWIGTPNWMAPEVLTQQEYNQSIDMWSYGMILYEMLSNTYPYQQFAEWTMQDFVQHVAQEKQVPDLQLCIPQKNTYLNDTLHQIIAQCWKFDAKTRPTAQDVYLILSEYMAIASFKSNE